METAVLTEVVHLHDQRIVEILWELTKPRHVRHLGWAKRYQAYLLELAEKPPIKRFESYFFRPKKRGGTRLIRSATRPLYCVQNILSLWLTVNCADDLGDDYCYLGNRGVMDAVRVHLGARYGLVVDLKDAFHSVTVQKLYPILDRCLYRFLPDYEVRDPVIQLILDLVTFENIAPQGCVSTPIFYNLVVKEIDDQIKAFCQARGLRYTRYSDNICVSALKRFDLVEVEAFVRCVIGQSGFQISWVLIFDQAPIEYLGTLINDQLRLKPDQIAKYEWLLKEAIQHPTPDIYKKQIAGILVWADQIGGQDLPERLLELFDQYYVKVKPPETYRKLRQMRLV